MEEPELNLKDQAVEAILFLKGEAVSLDELSAVLETDREVIEQSLQALEERLKFRGGLALIRSGDTALLSTNPELGSLIEKVLRYELQKDIGKAGREALAIVLYYHPIAKREIDHIRGVNSASILRTLAIRGLIEKQSSKTGLSVYYSPTVDLLAHLGVGRPEELPEYETTQARMKKLFAEK